MKNVRILPILCILATAASPTHALLANYCRACAPRHLFTTLAVAQDSALANSIPEWRAARAQQRELLSLFRTLPGSTQKQIKNLISSLDRDQELKLIRRTASRVSNRMERQDLIRKGFRRFEELLSSHPIISDPIWSKYLKECAPPCDDDSPATRGRLSKSQ